MNKKIFSLLVLILFTLSGFSDDDGGVRKFRFGLTATPTLGWMKPDVKGYDNAGMRFGFAYGILTDFSLSGNGNYAFSTGVNVLSAGGKLKYPDIVYPIADVDSVYFTVGTETEATYKLQYINIPLTLKMRTKEIGYITYFGQFGLDAGINIKARQDYKTDYPGKTISEEDIDIQKDIQFARVALVVGVGIEYSLSGNTAALIGVTFNNGFTNVLKGKAYELENDGTVKVSANSPVDGPKRKSISNFIALNLGIFF